MLALLTVAAHPSDSPPAALASLLLAGAGPVEQAGGEEETGRDGWLLQGWRRQSLPQAPCGHLHRRAAESGLWGPGGTWGQQERRQSGACERVERSQAGRRKQRSAKLIIFGSRSVWHSGIRRFLGAAGLDASCWGCG